MADISFIDVSSNNKNNYINPNKLEPLGIEYVCSAALSAGNKANIFSDTFGDIDDVLANISAGKSIIVGVSAYTASFDRALCIAHRIKLHNNNTIIIFGGPHASSNPDIIAEDCIDYVIVGEGESKFVKLLYAISNSMIKPNTVIVDDNSFPDELNQELHKADMITDFFDSWPIRRSDFIARSKISGLIFPRVDCQAGVAQISNSRGCGNKCSYCPSSLIFGNEIKFRKLDSIISEIKYLLNNFNVNLLYFTDANFLSSKFHINKLCDEITKNKIHINWYCLCNVHSLDYSILKEMKDAGCIKIGVGIETILSGLFLPYRKADLFDIDNSLKSADALGILIRGFFMIGFPWETVEDLESIPNILSRLPLDELRITFFTPFRGTPAYNRFKKYLSTYENDKYSTNEPILENDSISRERYFELRNYIYKSFYTSTVYQRRVKQKIMKYPHLRESYNAFFEELFSEGIL